MKSIRSIIVDDERLARIELKRLLKEFPQIHVVGDAQNIEGAINLINQQSPDLIFLDIQLRNETGFDLLKKVNYNGDIIFVTAWDKYAVRAFEVNALDYLQKPVSKNRLSLSIQRLTSSSLYSSDLKPLNIDDLIFLNFGKKIQFLPVKKILKIDAEGQYTEVMTVDGEKGLVHKLLKDWEIQLPNNYYLRVHRSTIINISQIHEISKWSNFSYQINLIGYEKPITVSRRYAQKLREKFG